MKNCASKRDLLDPTKNGRISADTVLERHEKPFAILMTKTLNRFCACWEEPSDAQSARMPRSLSYIPTMTHYRQNHKMNRPFAFHPPRPLSAEKPRKMLLCFYLAVDLMNL
uniref:Uncharacterized protein n=1 Tax=Steinernema glaseri TaxID=37863 RepID=A0A1I7ZRU0_9BILA